MWEVNQLDLSPLIEQDFFDVQKTMNLFTMRSLFDVIKWLGYVMDLVLFVLFGMISVEREENENSTYE